MSPTRALRLRTTEVSSGCTTIVDAVVTSLPGATTIRSTLASAAQATATIVTATSTYSVTRVTQGGRRSSILRASFCKSTAEERRLAILPGAVAAWSANDGKLHSR